MQRKTRRNRGTRERTRGGKHYTKRSIQSPRTPRNSPSRNPPALSPTTLDRIARIAAEHRIQQNRERMLQHQALGLGLTARNNNSPDVLDILGLSPVENRPRSQSHSRSRRVSPN